MYSQSLESVYWNKLARVKTFARAYLMLYYSSRGLAHTLDNMKIVKNITRRCINDFNETDFYRQLQNIIIQIPTYTYIMSHISTNTQVCETQTNIHIKYIN